MKTTDQIIEDALDVLDTFGHCKDQLQDEGGRVCAVGALNYATIGGRVYSSRDVSDTEQHTEYVRAYGRILDAANANGIEWISIPDFNDDPRTSTEDVKLVFKRALSHDDH